MKTYKEMIKGIANAINNLYNTKEPSDIQSYKEGEIEGLIKATAAIFGKSVDTVVDDINIERK